MRPALEVPPKLVKVVDGIDPLHHLGAVGVAQHGGDAGRAGLPHARQARRVPLGAWLAVPVGGLEVLERAVDEAEVGAPVAAEAGDGVEDAGGWGVGRVGDPVPVPGACQCQRGGKWGTMLGGLA